MFVETEYNYKKFKFYWFPCLYKDLINSVLNLQNLPIPYGFKTQVKSGFRIKRKKKFIRGTYATTSS